ncbi:hypothetical protein Gpo141_00004986 [Globisporangium polare]
MANRLQRQETRYVEEDYADSHSASMANKLKRQETRFVEEGYADSHSKPLTGKLLQRQETRYVEEDYADSHSKPLRRQETRYVEEEYEDANVSYWQMHQPHGEADATANSEDETRLSDSDDSEYELLAQSDASTRKILEASEFYDKFMPRGDRVSESLLQFCGSFPVRMGPIVVASLVRRFTDARFNWETKTLQSFLEVAVWVSVTYAALSMSNNDWLFAFQVGTFAGALMSVCDEIVLHFVRGLARVIRNQHGGRELLEQLGFDVPKNGKAPTDGRELALIKTLVFGYLGVVGIRSLWTNFHDVKYFALLAAAAGVAFVVTAEFFCLWLPTRRIGLTLQSRFTKTAQNWSEHAVRSFVELVCWASSTVYFYHTSQDFFSSLQLGTLVAVALSLSSGLDDLPDIVSSDEKSALQNGEYYTFWQEHASGDVLMALAGGIVAAQKAVASGVRSAQFWRSAEA